MPDRFDNTIRANRHPRCAHTSEMPREHSMQIWLGDETLRYLRHRNPEIGEGIIVHTAEFDVRFWHRPGMPHAVNELPGVYR